MSRSLGDFQFKMKKNRPADKQMVISVPHIDKIKNEKIDFILIGCDGVWEGHPNEWYFDLVHEKVENKENPDEIVEGILDNVVAESLDGDDGHDNMTVILVLTKGEYQ
jgi:serine/threonine protein phosphatase PrpC